MAGRPASYDAATAFAGALKRAYWNATASSLDLVRACDLTREVFPDADPLVPSTLRKRCKYVGKLVC